MITFFIFRRPVIAGWGRDLWMEVRSSGGPDKNRVYGLSNTTAENLQGARSVSTVGSSQSVSSTQSKEFVALQQHTAQLTEKYDHLSAAYAHFKAEDAQWYAQQKEKRRMHNGMHNKKRSMNSFVNLSWTWHHRVVIHVRLLLFGRITTSLLLLLQLYHYVNL